jgi:hypothetical protein
MAFTINWQGGDGVTTLPSGSYLGFFGDSFGTSITLGGYQSSSYATDVSASVNYGVLPNVMFMDSGSYSFSIITPSDSLDRRSLSLITENECTLRITISNTSPTNLQAMKLIAYNGVDTAVGPEGCIVWGVEKGNSTWSLMSGSANPLNLSTQVGNSGSYTYYVGLSVSPTSPGANLSVMFNLVGESF